MDSQKEKQIIKILQDNDANKVPFVQTKNQLLAAGFSEADIVYGLYSAPYDGQLNVPRPPNPLQKLYEQDPQKAQATAKLLLQDLAIQERDQAVLDSAAAEMGPDIQSRSYYSVRAADDLGISYFSLLFFGFLILGVALKFHWNSHLTNIIFLIYQVVIIAIFAYKMYQKQQLTKNKK